MGHTKKNTEPKFTIYGHYKGNKNCPGDADCPMTCQSQVDQQKKAHQKAACG